MAGPYCCERSLNRREPGVVMKVKPIGMLWMTLAGRPDHLLVVAWRDQKTPSQGRPMGRMNKFTVAPDNW